jgi:hypothetical protein
VLGACNGLALCRGASRRRPGHPQQPALCLVAPLSAPPPAALVVAELDARDGTLPLVPRLEEQGVDVGSAVELRQHGGQVEAVLTDEGKGFDADQARADAVHGAHVRPLGMRERTEVLVLSPATVERHRATLMAKLSLRSRAELIQIEG